MLNCWCCSGLDVCVMNQAMKTIYCTLSYFSEIWATATAIIPTTWDLVVSCEPNLDEEVLIRYTTRYNTNHRPPRFGHTHDWMLILRRLQILWRDHNPLLQSNLKHNNANVMESFMACIHISQFLHSVYHKWWGKLRKYILCVAWDKVAV